MIPIKNIYYMLSYAFQVLNEQGYKNIDVEQFDNVAELCAAILSKGMSIKIKRGLGREYIEQSDTISSLRGRIEISESIKSIKIFRRYLICSYDNFSVNSYVNRIIKTTMELLLHADISKSLKKEIRKILLFLSEVELLDIHAINWNMQYNRNNKTYQMLIFICYLVLKGLLQTKADGTIRLMDFLDEQRMYHLYEKFILEYYRKEISKIKEIPRIIVSSPMIDWAVDNEVDDMLPFMKTDIMLNDENVNKILIIDAKYYSNIMQVHYNKPILSSDHLYQIFSYVKNKDMDPKLKKSCKVSGMLLYAQTNELIQPKNKTYMICGNKISVRTLDLNCDFSIITNQLNEIVIEHFGKTR